MKLHSFVNKESLEVTLFHRSYCTIYIEVGAVHINFNVNELLLYLDKWSVHRMVVWDHRVIGRSVISNQEGPAPPIAAVLVTAVQQVTVEE